MARLRDGPIFGILENKLLSHSLLHSLGVPALDIAYGALARAQLGEWDTYREGSMRAALVKAHGWGRGGVLKPATDGGNVGALILSGMGALSNGSLQWKVDRHDGTRWRRLRWATEGVLAHVRQHMAPDAPSARWAQRYMHRGVLLQERYSCAPRECRAAEMSRAAGVACGARGAGCILEVKTHVVFGRLSCIVVERVPVSFNVSLYVTVRGTGVADCSPSPGAVAANAAAAEGEAPFTCEHFLKLVQPLLPTLAEQAAQISSLLLADWFRLDVFLGHPELGLRVNEITYPSHVKDTCALRQWLHKYKTLRLRPTSGRDIFARLANRLGIDNSTFFANVR